MSRTSPARCPALYLLCMLVGAFGTNPTRAQTPSFPERDGTDTAIVEALDRLNRTLGEIGDSLREIRASQVGLILMQRVDSARKELVPLEQELRRLRSDRSRLEDQITMMEDRADSMEGVASQLVASELASTRSTDALARNEIDFAIESMRRGLKEMDKKIAELESSIVPSRRATEVLENRLRDWLDRFDE